MAVAEGVQLPEQERECVPVVDSVRVGDAELDRLAVIERHMD